MAAWKTVDLETIPLLIFETPFAVWSLDAKSENIDFLNSIQPRYFSYLAELYGSQLTGPDRHFAATALRGVYVQGLETLFSLIGATLQAPDAPAAYLLKYRGEIRSVVEAITHDRPLNTIWNFPSLSWKVVADSLLLDYGDDAVRQMNVEGFSSVWNYLAREYLNPHVSKEYNSIKHGLRLKMGGFSIAISSQGDEQSEAKSHTFGGSDFGSTFFTVEIIEESKNNIYFQQISNNWDVLKMIEALKFIDLSIRNILVFLQHHLGIETARLDSFLASDARAFEFIRRTSVGVLNFHHNIKISVTPDKLWTKAMIFDSYKRTVPTEGI